MVNNYKCCQKRHLVSHWDYSAEISFFFLYSIVKQHLQYKAQQAKAKRVTSALLDSYENIRTWCFEIEQFTQDQKTERQLTASQNLFQLHQTARFLKFFDPH